jgi:hypothetical protein
MRALVCTFILLPAWLAAQWSGNSIPRFTVKTNVTTSIVPAKLAVNLASDIRLAPRWSADADVGLFYASTIFAKYKNETYIGPRLRAGFKYYYKQDASAHIGLQVKYQSITNMTHKNMLRQGGQYQEILLVKRTVNSVGAAVRIGYHQYFGAQKHLLLDLYTGLGILYHDVAVHLPPDAELLQDGNALGEIEPGKRFVPDVLFGIHLGYCFW